MGGISAQTKSTECGGQRHFSVVDSLTQEPWQPGAEAAVQNVLKLDERTEVKVTIANQRLLEDHG